MQTFLHGVTLLLAVAGALLVLVLLVRQPCQRLLDLTCHILFVHFERLLHALLVLLLSGVGVGVATSTAVLAAAVVAALRLTAFSLDVHTLFADALALFLLAATACRLSAVGLTCFLFTFATLLFLRLLLRPRVLVDGRQVDFAQHIHLRSQLLLALQGEHTVLPHLTLGRLLLFLLFFGLGRLLFSRSDGGSVDGRRLWFRCNGFLWLGFRLCGLNRLRLRHRFGRLRCFLRLGFLHDGFLAWLHDRSDRSRLFLGLGFRLGLGRFGSRRRGFLLGLLCWCFRLLRCRFLTEAVQVYLAQRLELLLGLTGRLGKFGSCLFGLRLLVFLVLCEELSGHTLHFLVLAELLHKGFVLLIAQLEAQVGPHFSQVASLLKELHCRLESDVQFSDCFI